MLTDVAHQEKRKLLDSSLKAGIIDRARFDECLAQLGQEGPRVGYVETQTRWKGDQLVAHNSGMWLTMGSGFDTSKQAMKEVTSVVHGDNKGMWAWNTAGTKQYKRCNFHKDCPVMLRAVQNPDFKWRQEVLDVSHALELKEYRRKNSPFTFKEETEVQKEVDLGKKPHQMRNDATLDAISEGVTEKREDGGLVGAIHRCVTRYMSDTCLIHE
jgi:hypothetical protein